VTEQPQPTAHFALPAQRPSALTWSSRNEGLIAAAGRGPPRWRGRAQYGGGGTHALLGCAFLFILRDGNGATFSGDPRSVLDRACPTKLGLARLDPSTSGPDDLSDDAPMTRTPAATGAASMSIRRRRSHAHVAPQRPSRIRRMPSGTPAGLRRAGIPPFASEIIRGLAHGDQAASLGLRQCRTAAHGRRISADPPRRFAQILVSRDPGRRATRHHVTIVTRQVPVRLVTRSAARSRAVVLSRLPLHLRRPPMQETAGTPSARSPRARAALR
jgi:hypothetical protein